MTLSTNTSKINNILETINNLPDSYVKPSTGIPKADLASDVQTSLELADSALQSVPSTFFVTFTTTDDVTVCDKTYAEITAAAAAGNTIRGRDANNFFDYAGTKLGLVTGHVFYSIFPGLVGGMIEAVYYAGYSVSSSDSVKKVSGSLQLGITTKGILKGTNSTQPATAVPGVDYLIPSDIAEKQDKPALVTSGTNITLADNTEYRLNNVTSLSIAYPSGNFDCWLKITTASSGTISITLPTSTYINDPPFFANGETWELSIKDGIIVAGKAVSV